MRLKKKPGEEELSFLLLQLYMLLTSGITLDRALESLSGQYEEPIRSALIRMKGDIQKGVSVHQAFADAGIFPDLVPQMLRSAQRGQSLEELLKTAGEFLRQSAELKNRLISAVSYPLVVIGMSAVSLLVVLKLVIPRISQVLVSLGRELPLTTKALLFLSSLMGYALYLAPLLVLLYLMRDRLLGRERWDRLFLRVPLLGEVSYCFNLSRFAHLLRVNLSAGVPVERALLLSSSALSNAYMKSSIEGVIREVVRGMPIHRALASSGVFTEFFIGMVGTGERSGEMESALDTLREFYHMRAVRLVERWTRLAEPVAMILVGLLVGFVVLSVLLPLTEISGGIK